MTEQTARPPEATNPSLAVVDPRIADLPHRVYVPNELSNDVAVIDPETFEVIGRFAVGSAVKTGPPASAGCWTCSPIPR